MTFQPNESNQKIIVLTGGEGSLKCFSTILPMIENEINATIVFLTDFPSTMCQLVFSKLQTISSMEIKIVEDHEIFTPNTLYVVSKDITGDFEMHSGYLSFFLNNTDHTNSIDKHCKTLASICEEHLVAVMLSGKGVEGIEGFGEINEKGGLTLSHLPQETVCHEKPYLSLFQEKSMGAISAIDLSHFLNDISKKPVINMERSTYL